MKRGGPEHPKVRALAERLNIHRMHAVGMLEVLWHATARHHPQGNIGKWPDTFIATAVEWEGDPTALVNALVDCGLFDRHPEHRLLVHDWHEHADDSTKKALTRSGRPFLSGQVQTSPANVRTSPDSGGTVKAGLGKAGQGSENRRDKNSFDLACDALARWAFGTPLDECMSGSRREVVDAIEAIEKASVDLTLVPKAITHLVSVATPCKGVAYAAKVILGTIDRRDWEKARNGSAGRIPQPQPNLKIKYGVDPA